MEIYVVKSGDSIYFIANAYSLDVNTLIFNNQLIYPYEPVPGQALFIGTGIVSQGSNILFDDVAIGR